MSRGGPEHRLSHPCFHFLVCHCPLFRCAGFCVCDFAAHFSSLALLTKHREYGFEQRRRDKRNLFSHTLSRITFVLFLLKTCATVYVQFTGDISYETRAGIYQIVIALCFAGLAIYIFKFMPFYKRYANVVYLAFFSIWYALLSTTILPRPLLHRAYLPLFQFYGSARLVHNIKVI